LSNACLMRAQKGGCRRPAALQNSPARSNRRGDRTLGTHGGRPFHACPIFAPLSLDGPNARWSCNLHADCTTHPRRVFGGMGAAASPSARSIHCQSEPPRSTSDPIRRVYGEAPGTAPVTLGCRVWRNRGPKEGPGCSGCQAGFRWGAETRQNGNEPEAGAPVGEMAPSWADRAAHYELLNRGRSARMITNAETCSTETGRPQPRCSASGRNRSVHNQTTFVLWDFGLRPNVDSPNVVWRGTRSLLCEQTG